MLFSTVGLVKVARRIPQDRNAIRCLGEGSGSQPVVIEPDWKEPIMTAPPNIVLVHGAWANGSSWSAVIEHTP